MPSAIKLGDGSLPKHTFMSGFEGVEVDIVDSFVRITRWPTMAQVVKNDRGEDETRVVISPTGTAVREVLVPVTVCHEIELDQPARTRQDAPGTIAKGGKAGGPQGRAAKPAEGNLGAENG